MKAKFYSINLLIALLVGTTSLIAQPISVTVNVAYAGGLSSCIATSKKDLVEKLKVTGVINGTDIGYLRNMAMLSELDLSEVYIKAGGSPVASIYVYGARKFDSKGIPIWEYYWYDVYTKADQISSYTFSNFNNLTSLKLPNSTTKIGGAGIIKCKNLKQLTIGANTSNIELYGSGMSQTDDDTFIGCDNLKEIDVEDKNIYFTSINGVLYSKSKTKLFYFPPANSISIIIPKGVTSIGDNAFSQAAKLKEIHCQNPTPPATGNDVFKNVNKATCKLYVPKGSYSAYWIAGQWGDFINIIEENTTTDISSMELEIDQIYALGHTVYVRILNSSVKNKITIYDINGRLISSQISNSTLTSIPINQNGVYIVHVIDGNKMCEKKLIIKA